MFLKKTNFKLTLVFTTSFVLGVGILYGLTFYSLFTSLRQEDHAVLRSRLLSYWAQYQVGGVEELIEEIDVEGYLEPDRLFFVRIADDRNRTILLNAPNRWEPFWLDRLGSVNVIGLEEIVTLSSPDFGYSLEMAAIRLSEDHILQIGIATEFRDRLLMMFQRNFLFLVAAMLVAGLSLGPILTARFLAPVSRLNDVVRSIIDTGRFSARIPGSGSGDDLDELVSAFNRMLVRIESLVEGMKSTLDIVAHDLRTPMARLRGMAEIALHGPEDISVYREALSDCLEESETVLVMLNTIMDISEVESGAFRLEKTETDLVRIIMEVVDLYRFVAEERCIRIETELPPSLVTYLDAPRIRRAIGNLLDNAVKYSPDETLVMVRVVSEQRFLRLEIEDNGPGIPEDETQYIWSRLYRGMDAKSISGLGLGLSMVKAVVEAHGGEAGLENLDISGCRFIIRLPAGPASGGSVPAKTITKL